MLIGPNFPAKSLTPFLLNESNFIYLINLGDVNRVLKK